MNFRVYLQFDILGVYMRLIVSGVFSLEKDDKIWKNQLFFAAATALFGKCCMGGHGWIGV